MSYGCVVIAWINGNRSHHNSYFDCLKEHLDYHYTLEDLNDIDTIFFRGLTCVYPDFEYSYHSKDRVITRLVNYFNAHAYSDFSIYCADCR